MRVLIAGGGTGGHFYPALAVMEEFAKRKRGVKLAYVGTRRGIEARILPSYPWISFFPIHVRGLQRGNVIQNLYALSLLVVSFVEMLIVLLRFRPHVVIGMGGYASFPAVFLASLLGKIVPMRTVIHEQNAVAGLTNRILARFVDKVLISYPQTKEQLAVARKIVTTGNPIRSEFLLAKRTRAAYERFGLSPEKRTVLVFGGSNGSLAITNAIRKARSEIARHKDMQVLLVTGGSIDTSIIESELAAAEITNIVVRKYIERMGEAFAIADLIVSRAGATTLAEITSCGKPAVLIPWGGAADGHQWENARVLNDERACTVVGENDIHRRLARLIEQMVKDEQGLNLMAQNSIRMGSRHAAASMLGEIMILVERART
ncbi:MAG TPA: undecaprenyldiphospho-muramoylpentapeptide beta-N-acetylglucosaminyltransferase [Candidatus Acetothermia bacterium]|nr:undecaprenyldiphospho-muramoylpentapeptide beta-N-acetylglucosaminyltransferase [Candidatus Acetothermia bacterium]